HTPVHAPPSTVTTAPDYVATAGCPHHQGQKQRREETAPKTRAPRAGGDEARDQPPAAPAHRRTGHEQAAAPCGVRSEGHPPPPTGPRARRARTRAQRPDARRTWKSPGR